MHVCVKAYRCTRFCLPVCCMRVRVLAGMCFCVCVCASVRKCERWSFPSRFGKRVKRPASEENSILSCSYTVVNDRAILSHCVNMSVAFFFFPLSTVPQPLYSFHFFLLHFPECLMPPAPTLVDFHVVI